MKTIATTEMPRKNGRRMDAGSVDRRPQAPPSFLRNMKPTWSLMTSTRVSGQARTVCSRDSAHHLVPRSSPSDTMDTTARNT